MYEIYIYNENGDVVGQTATTECRVADSAKKDAKFVTGINKGWTYHCNGFSEDGRNTTYP